MRYLSSLILSLGLLSGCSQEKAAETAAIVRPVTVQRVLAQGGNRQRTFSGSARSGLASKLSFRVSGTLQQLSLKLGDQVEKDQLIARLDGSDYKLQVDDAEASLRQAQAQSRSMGANYERIRGLYENNSVSINDLDAARAANESATALVQSITKKLELANSQLSYTELRAPLAGKIAEIRSEVNENVAAGQAIAVLDAGTLPEVLFAVPEQLIAEVRVGNRVKVSFDAVPGQSYEATVTEVGVASRDLASTYPVVARLFKDNEAIRSGMAAQVEMSFGQGEKQARVFIKPKAVSEDRDGKNFVFLAVPSAEGKATVTKTLVKTGELTGNGLEVLEGLEDGQLVITAGLRFLSEGMIVSLSQAPQE